MLGRVERIIPQWGVLLIGLVMVAGVGYVDYVTGDYSLLIFYLIPVSFVCWCNGYKSGVAIGIASGAARFISDAYLYKEPHLHYWNSFQDMVFLLFVGLLVTFVRKELYGKRDDES
jgi:hypothetical protein